MRHRRFKALLATASALLLIGAGCAGQYGTDVSTEVETGGAKEEGMMVKTGGEVDAAADAYLNAASEEQGAASAEDADASSLTTTEAEVNAYGQAYDKSEF